MRKRNLESRSIGHAWDRPGDVSFGITSVVKTHNKPGQYSTGNPSSGWLLDYTLTPFGRYQVRHPGSSWRERHAFEAHVYPPGSRKWEDTTSVRLPCTESIFITFLTREGGPLAGLVGNHGYAKFKDPSRRLLPFLERILRDGLELDDEGFWRAQAALYEIVALLLKAEWVGGECYEVGDVDAPASPFTDLVRNVRLYLREHLAERIRRRDLARHLKMSVSALADRYRAEAGESPLATLTRMRMNLAKSLMLRGYRLKTIAEQTGFCDEFHLSKVFKRWNGLSPRAFRSDPSASRRHTWRLRRSGAAW